MMAAIDWKGKAFIESNDIAWEDLGAGVQRKILGHNDELMMTVVKFEQDAVGALHHHIHRQIAYVAEGSFEVTIDGTTKVLKAGDCYLVASDIVHGVLALEPGMLVDIFTPARQDFL